MPDDGGECESHVDEWYYNADEGRCAPFMYGDCPQNGNIFPNEDECKNACMRKGPPETSKGSKGRPRPQVPGGSSQETGGPGHRRPVKGSSTKKPAQRQRPMRPTGGWPPTKQRFPKQNKRPGGGGNRWPPKEKKRPGRANCGVSIKRGMCDDYTSMWYFNGQFGFCSRVPQGRCPTHGSFFESCEECMEKCNRAKVSRCNRKG